MIEVRNLTKTFWVHKKKEGFQESLKSLFHRPKTAVRAVEEISFSIGSGEIVGFLGPNGAGKTTTLKTLSGLLYPTAGTVSVAGFTPFRRDHDFLRVITLVMGQKQQLLWDLSAADSLRLNQVLYEIPEPSYRRTLGLLSDLLELHSVIDKPMRTLSLGERMKCELAAAMLHQPQVLFLDEPTIGLDVNVQKKVRDFIGAYRREFGATVLLTSHYMADVTALADRILVIDGGRIIFQGARQDLMDRFSSRKVLKLRFETPVAERALLAYGAVSSVKALEAALLVPREAVSKLAARILQALPVADISIEDEPFEDVLAQLFETSKDSGS